MDTLCYAARFTVFPQDGSTQSEVANLQSPTYTFIGMHKFIADFKLK
jgi:hypothetical protein